MDESRDFPEWVLDQAMKAVENSNPATLDGDYLRAIHDRLEDVLRKMTRRAA